MENKLFEFKQMLKSSKAAKDLKTNDEQFTPVDLIVDELAHWADLGKFTGKNIICPCDWDICDDDTVYAATMSTRAGKTQLVLEYIKKQLMSDKVEITHKVLVADEVDYFLDHYVSNSYLQLLGRAFKLYNINSLTVTGYRPETGLGHKFEDNDYTKYDIVITTPPFSMINKFLDCIDDKADYIIMTPFMSRVSPAIATRLMDRKAYLGFNRHLEANFLNMFDTGEYGLKRIACDWLTSFDEAQKGLAKSCVVICNPPYSFKATDTIIGMTMKDGTNPVQVKASQIPADYNGWMFTSVNVLDSLNYDEYEWYITNCLKYFNKTHREMNPLRHDMTLDMYKRADGSKAFSGVLLRRKLS